MNDSQFLRPFTESLAAKPLVDPSGPGSKWQDWRLARLVVLCLVFGCAVSLLAGDAHGVAPDNLAHPLGNPVEEKAQGTQAVRPPGKPSLLWQGLIPAVGLLALRLMAPRLSRRYEARRASRKVDRSPEDLLLDEASLAPLFEGLRAGSAEPQASLDAPNASGVEPAEKFFRSAPAEVAKLKELFEKITRTAEDSARRRMLLDLSGKVRFLNYGSRHPELRPIWQLSFALEGLLKQLATKESEVTPSGLQTVAGGLDLLKDLCAQGGKPGPIDEAPVKLLVVDDDAVGRSIVSSALKKVFDAADLAADGGTALAMLERQAYDVIFLDVEMPGMDGFELCKKIRAGGLNQESPVVFVTRHSGLEARAQAVLSGGQHLLGKPFLAHELTAKAVTLALQSRYRSGPAKVQSGRCERKPALGPRFSTPSFRCPEQLTPEVRPLTPPSLEPKADPIAETEAVVSRDPEPAPESSLPGPSAELSVEVTPEVRPTPPLVEPKAEPAEEPQPVLSGDAEAAAEPNLPVELSEPPVEAVPEVRPVSPPLVEAKAEPAEGPTQTVPNGQHLPGKRSLAYRVTRKVVALVLGSRNGSQPPKAEAGSGAPKPVAEPSLPTLSSQAPAEVIADIGAASQPLVEVNAAPTGEPAAARAVPAADFLESLDSDWRSQDELKRAFYERAQADLERFSIAIYAAGDRALQEQLLAVLCAGLRSFVSEAKRAGLSSIHQLGVALDGLLCMMRQQPDSCTNFRLGTARAALDLLSDLCTLERDPDLNHPPVRTLVVDADPLARHMLAGEIQMALPEPDTAGSGEATLALAKNRPFDLIFLDVRLGGMDGFAACSQIHATRANRATPVIFVSGESSLRTRSLAAAAGASGFIAKPLLAGEVRLTALTFALRGRLGVSPRRAPVREKALLSA